MAYQLPHESSTKCKFNDYSVAGAARMNHDETLLLSLKTPIQFFIRMFFDEKTLLHQFTGKSSRSPEFDQSNRPPSRSTFHPYTRKLMSDLNLIIHDLCNCNDNIDINDSFTRMTEILTKFLEMTPRDGADKSEEYLQILIHSSIPAALVKLYVSRFVTTKQVAHGCICQFIDSCKTLFANRVTIYGLFAPILSEFCKILRGAAGVNDDLYIYSQSSLAAMMKWYVHNVKYVLRLQYVFPFVRELAAKLSCALELSVQLAEFINLSDNDVREFIKFMHPFPFLHEAGNERLEIEGVHCVFLDLLEKLELCQKKLESQLGLINKERCGPIELESISKLFKGLEEMFWEKMRQRRVALCFLIEGRHKSELFYEMLIYRSSLFEESFEYIGHASPRSLQCQNALFVSFPNDGKRFFPNPSKHRVQLSITFGRVLFLQIAGEDILFEYIRDADPYLYSGCKKILEMDRKMVDDNILGLIFFCEDEELGSRKMVELCLNGKNTIVANFARGFGDKIIDRWLRESFYRILDHKVLNRMLHGSKTTISVEDWKEHTNYNGYKKMILKYPGSGMYLFLTSIKSLPVEGFGGLDSKLHIYRTSDSHDFLPFSDTCFYHLCFPPYPSMDVMQNRLNIITQNYVGCSFGAK
ncbi:hypothetical protein H5410_045161 [Solanum commersonii]|uniref:HECT-type E3 ubiquitin transferase n=1 Tax=Solanum commersonii TaxID=4109 RepID=A0A9J5XAR6_SOLCO|nr:hypothetical protein H5410_045161 [Solanum commersonii]